MAPRPIRFIFLALCGTGMLWVTFSRARDLLQLDVSIGLGICSIVLGLGLIFFSLRFDELSPFLRQAMNGSPMTASGTNRT